MRMYLIREIQMKNGNGTTKEEDRQGHQLNQSDRKRILAPNTITIVHGSVTGTCSKLAQELETSLKDKHLLDRTIQMGPLEDWDWWDELLNFEEDDDEDDSDDKNNQNHER